MATTAQTLNDLAHAKSHRVEMMFLPQAWQAVKSAPLEWHAIDFPPSPNTLPKKPGVYVFVVIPNIFDFQWACGLFYVGKATNLYSRVSAYVSEINKDFLTSKRPLIWKMINQWNGHLKYFYTTTTTVGVAKNLEAEMLEAFRPPFNTQYEATTSHIMRAFP